MRVPRGRATAPSRPRLGGKRPARVKRIAGVALIELISALALLAVMSTMGFAALGRILDAEARAEAHLEQLARTQVTFSLFGRDMVQLWNRPRSTGSGTGQPALRSQRHGRAVRLEFMRLGSNGPVWSQRRGVQTVAYQIIDGRLFRDSRQTPARPASSAPPPALLLDGLSGANIRFLDEQRNWQTHWPPADAPARWGALPVAVELSVTIDGWGRLHRLFRPPEPWEPSRREAANRNG